MFSNDLPSFDSLDTEGTSTTGTGKRRGRPVGVKNGQGTTPIDERKQSLYFADLDLLQELKSESKRINRPLSWVVSHLCKVGMADLKAMPTLDGSSDSDV